MASPASPIYRTAEARKRHQSVRLQLCGFRGPNGTVPDPYDGACLEDIRAKLSKLLGGAQLVETRGPQLDGAFWYIAAENALGSCDWARISRDGSPDRQSAWVEALETIIRLQKTELEAVDALERVALGNRSDGEPGETTGLRDESAVSDPNRPV